MAERRGSNSNIWIIVGLGLTALMAVSNGFWSLANPKGDITELKNDTRVQLKEMREDLATLKKDMDWRWATKDLVTGKVETIDKENATYRRGMEILFSGVKSKVDSMDTEMHNNSSPRDTILQMNSRIQELERAVRDSARQPVSVTQK